jgi:hypothetical protein
LRHQLLLARDYEQGRADARALLKDHEGAALALLCSLDD